MEELATVDEILTKVDSLDEYDKIRLYSQVEQRLDEEPEAALENSFDGEDISIQSGFGLWRGRDITKEDLRRKAWRRF
jgi:hypothetical protein